MKQDQNTQPREWRRDGENIVDDSVHSGHEIAVLKRGASDGDGDLIAAAPDLLAALKNMTEQFSIGELNVKKDYSKMVAHAAAIKAIRKATGETP